MQDVIRRRRSELGLSQADLATAAGMDKRQIRRYEAGDAQPTLSAARAIAHALAISLDELAGDVAPHRVDLTGDWWMGWQSFKDGEEITAFQGVRFAQHAELVQLSTLTRGRAVDDGGYHWHGELRVWDNEILMGWYTAKDGSVRSKGTMYFVLHPHGVNMSGRWVGLSYDGAIVTGWGSAARTEEEARTVMTALMAGKGAVSG